MLRDAEILIMDEPTSALDSLSESLIHDALVRLTAGRTTIVIAHRFSTIAHADNIVLIENGRLVEAGPQTDLLSRETAFKRLHDLQILRNTAA